MTTMSIELQTNSAINVVDLSASKDSKIDNISIYPGRAEITRLFEFEIKAGQNKVTILNLPPSLLLDTLSVEGQENVFLHDVIVTKTSPHSESDSSAIRSNEVLSRKKEQIKKAIERAQVSQKFIDSYLESVNGADISRLGLETALDNYNALSEKVDLQIIDLKDELEEVRQKISKNIEDSALLVQDRWQASFYLHGQLDQKVNIQLKYAVHSAYWSASYDVRVDTRAQGKTVTILYKAAITQNTGESWINAPLTLETANPSFGIQTSPELQPWSIFASASEEPDEPQPRPSSRRRSWFRRSRSPWRRSVSPPPTITYHSPDQEGHLTHGRVSPGLTPIELEVPQVRQGRSPTITSEGSISSRSSGRSRSRSLEFLSRSPRSRSPSARVRAPSPFPAVYSPRPILKIKPQEVGISGEDNIFASFRVPGLVCIPSDGGEHYVTVAELNFDDALLRYGMPSIDKRVYLKADIKNSSDYLFIPGPAKIYVDRSFMATIRIPFVSPQEAFTLPLGLDPYIQLTYHPLDKTFNKSRLFQKTSTITCTQRITVLSTKSSAIHNLKVIDHVPISKNQDIEIKILSPALGDPSAMPIAKANQQVQVSPNVAAYWDGTDDPDVDRNEVGKHRKINWKISTVQPLEKISLSLQYEINAPENLSVLGI